MLTMDRAGAAATETATSDAYETETPSGLSSSAVEDTIAEIAISDLLTNGTSSGMPEDADDFLADQVRRIDVRGALDRERVDAYKLALKRGEELGPILVAVVDGVQHVASGWHRTVAYAESGRDSVAAIRRHMTMVEAVEAAIEGNRRHGHSPTAADVAKSLERLWEVYPDRKSWPNGKLADLCGVSEKTVRAAEAFLPATVRAARGSNRMVVRKGKEYTMAAPVSSTKNEDGWKARKPAPGTGAATKRDIRNAVDDALRLTQQALTKVQTVGLGGASGMPDDALEDWAGGIKPDVLEAKAAAAEECAAFLTAFATALRGRAGKEG